MKKYKIINYDYESSIQNSKNTLDEKEKTNCL